MSTSIASKLIILVSACTAVILGLGMWIDYSLSRDEILTRLRIEAQETVKGVVTDMENSLDAIEDNTRFLARILQQREYSLPGLDQMLRDIVINNDDIFGATIALQPTEAIPTGFAPYYYHQSGGLAYADLRDGDTQYWQQSWFTDPVNAGNAVWVEPYFDKNGGKVLMTTFAAPVYRVGAEGDRQLYAVVTADITLKALDQYLQRLRLGKEGQGFLLSRAGIILSSRDPTVVMEHYLDAVKGSGNTQMWTRLFRGAKNNQVQSGRVACPDSEGECMLRMSTLKSTGWPVGVFYSEREILAPLYQYQIKTAAIGICTLLLMAVAITLISRRLTRPLAALALAAEKIAQGKLDMPLPPASGGDEVAHLVRSFAAMQRDLKTYIGDLESAAASRSRLEGELAAAREIQMSMLAQGGEALERSKDYSLWAKVRPAKTVGGDLYSYYQASPTTLFIAVGDVSDKGVPAALFMAKAISHIQQFTSLSTTAADSMAMINDALEQGNDNCMFVTLFFGVLDLESCELRFASAGHTPPSLLRNGSATAIAQQTGPALGLAPKQSYPQNSLQLLPGDRLAIYTDGIDEAFNDQAQMFGSDRLDALLCETAKKPIEEVGSQTFAAVDEFAGSMPQSDDITLLLLDLPADAEPEYKEFRRFPADAKLVASAQQWLEHILEQQAIGHDLCFELLLVSEEVLTNIDKHGQLAADSSVDILVASNRQKVFLEFSDPGKPFDPLQESRRASLGASIESAEIGGLGVHLITQLTDQQSYQRRSERNLLRLEKQLTHLDA